MANTQDIFYLQGFMDGLNAARTLAQAELDDHKNHPHEGKRDVLQRLITSIDKLGKPHGLRATR